MSNTLRSGDRGPDVGRLQGLLNQRLRPSPNLRTDSNFARPTYMAVRAFQAKVGLGIDGVVGPRTWAALERRHALPAPFVLVSAPDAPWMAFATRELGTHETSGSEHNPRIIAYHASTSLRARTDETAWCSSFVNWCLQQAGTTGTNSAAAASWIHWGAPSRGQVGSITVIYNAHAAASLSISGNHVGFLVQDTGTHFVLLGGNQSDQVKVSRFPKASWTLKASRWPSA